MRTNTIKKDQDLIVGYQVSGKEWRIRINGIEHPSDFVSRSDIAEWVENMQMNGLYEGYALTFRGNA